MHTADDDDNGRVLCCAVPHVDNNNKSLLCPKILRDVQGRVEYNDAFIYICQALPGR